ncbi:MAG TPA: Wzz/FepE/Etk N-terminal domain-containing protein [Acidobacteriaceae bacterium]|jgi:tyrosine-protein kinase Etk/Wzc|nr:Wzz/FepE/Etk N-terminal domain-containing protein [Acidobacteriaceae bacterium]
MATETRDSELRTPAAPARATAATARGDEISLLDLLIVLASRRRMIAIVTLACAVLAAIVSLLLPKKYTATAVLLPPQQNSSLASTLASSQLGGLGSMAALAGGFSIKNPNDMYVAMLRSETVEDAMIEKFQLMREYRKRYLSDARKKFESLTTVNGDGKDGLIHISVEDYDPQRAADMANGYVEAFQKLSQSLAITEAGQRRLFFQQQLEKAKDDLANAEEALKQTEQTTGLIQLDSQARALIESAASLRAQIAAKEVQIQAMRTYATGENAQLVEAQQELDSLRAELAKLGGNEENANALIVPKGQMTQAGLEYVRRLRDVKYYETIFDILARQFEIAKLDEAKEGALVQVVDPAIRPDRRSFPKRTLIVLGATAAGLFFSILTALLQAGMARLREDPESSAKLALLRNMLTRRGHPLA